MNDTKPYSREEVIKNGEGFPKRGLYCQKCKTYIPQFEDLASIGRARIRNLIIDGRKILAVKELMALTVCSHRWAKIWVAHSGRPTPEYPGSPCPYCGKPLRTSLAKQCPHCFMDWHDKNNIKNLKAA